MRHSQGEMYIGHSRLCVCLSVPRRILTLLHGPGCKLRNGRGALWLCTVGRIYRGCVHSCMLHGTETWPVKIALQWAES